MRGETTSCAAPHVNNITASAAILPASMRTAELEDEIDGRNGDPGIEDHWQHSAYDERLQAYVSGRTSNKAGATTAENSDRRAEPEREQRQTNRA